MYNTYMYHQLTYISVLWRGHGYHLSSSRLGHFPFTFVNWSFRDLLASSIVCSRLGIFLLTCLHSAEIITFVTWLICLIPWPCVFISDSSFYLAEITTFINWSFSSVYRWVYNLVWLTDWAHPVILKLAPSNWEFSPDSNLDLPNFSTVQPKFN